MKITGVWREKILSFSSLSCSLLFVALVGRRECNDGRSILHACDDFDVGDIVVAIAAADVVLLSPLNNIKQQREWKVEKAVTTNVGPLNFRSHILKFCFQSIKFCALKT